MADAAPRGPFRPRLRGRDRGLEQPVLEARELRLGPGRTLLGGIDARRGGYRGFRVDRIRRLVDRATGERIETGILDRLMGRAEAQRRADALRIRRQTRARRKAAVAAVA